MKKGEEGGGGGWKSNFTLRTGHSKKGPTLRRCQKSNAP